MTGNHELVNNVNRFKILFHAKTRYTRIKL